MPESLEAQNEADMLDFYVSGIVLDKERRELQVIFTDEEVEEFRVLLRRRCRIRIVPRQPQEIPSPS